MKKPNYPYWLSLVMLVISVSGCENKQQENVIEQFKEQTQTSERPLLLLEKSSKEIVTVSLVKPETGVGARVAEVHVRFSGNLEYIKAVIGKSASDAHKDMHVQIKDKNIVRVVLFGSSNLNELLTGSLFNIEFRKKDNQLGQIEILSKGPIFAPEKANLGLIVGEPISI